MKPESLSLYLVTDRTLSKGRDLEYIVKEAVKGGVSMVQLREKDCDTGRFIELAGSLKKELSPLGIPLIINDRVDVALAVDADGVHIGQSDMPYEIARKLLGPDKIIGLSVENIDDLLKANELDVDYVGISPVYDTSTKTDTAPAFGLKGLKDAVRLSLHPTVAIGGMNAETAAEVMMTGCDGIAVVSAISSADSPSEAAGQLRNIVEANRRTLWTQSIWRKSSRIYNSILKEDFIKELSDGSLPVDRFSRYLAQDEVYLSNYYRQMFELAGLMDSESNKALFTAFAQSGMEGEQAMHQMLIEKYDIATDVKASVITKAYNDLTQSGIDCGNRCIALAGMLPCMWIYNRVGLHIFGNARLEGNPYKEWILEYGNQEFTEGVDTVLDIIDNWAITASEATIAKMDEYYLRAALYEYAFWDYGYHGDDKNYDYAEALEEWI